MSWNFALILFVLLVLTGIIWALDLAVLRRGRERRAQEAMAQYDAALIGDAQRPSACGARPATRLAACRGGSNTRSASSP